MFCHHQHKDTELCHVKVLYFMHRISRSACSTLQHFRLAHSEDFSVEIKTSEPGFEIITMTFRKTGRNMDTREIKVMRNGQELSLITIEPILPDSDDVVKYGLNFSLKVINLNLLMLEMLCRISPFTLNYDPIFGVQTK